jgi:predicted patatin/cPLA2 family phospholipase
MQKLRLLRIILFMFLFLAGCGLPRNPVPLGRIYDGQLAGFPKVRFWDIEYGPDVEVEPNDSSCCNFLVLSGGGAKGAFGAGFLNGWTDSGTRPSFKTVTGISTGALIAPLAFLGPEYDDELEKSYTTICTGDVVDLGALLSFGLLPAFFGESVADTKPLKNLISDLITPEILKAIADEHAKGRRLYVGTTNLDAQREVIWDMGAIASSGNPRALELFRKILLASASIPAAFPPVYFDVEINGEKYDEMHVDGGVITGMFSYGCRLFDRAQEQGVCNFYIIKNGKLDAEAEQVKRHSLYISMRSFSTLMKAQSWRDMMRLYVLAEKDNMGFHYISIPNNYESKGKEMFDPEEMKRLYDLGYEIAMSDNPWQEEIPFSSEEGEWIWTPAR